MKSGIITFPLEVDVNDKLKLLEAEFGTKGFAIIIKVFQFIYSKGYYTQWDKDVGCLFVREYCPDMGWELVSEVVACALRRGIFDNELYKKCTILTSSRIQETYLIATKRRKSIELDKRFLLPIAYSFIDNVIESGENVYIFKENVDSFRQRKEEESKEKESRVDKASLKKGKHALNSFTPPTFAEVQAYAIERGYELLAKKFYDFFQVNDWIDSRGNKVKNWKQKFITWENNNSSSAASRDGPKDNGDGSFNM